MFEREGQRERERDKASAYALACVMEARSPSVIKRITLITLEEHEK